MNNKECKQCAIRKEDSNFRPATQQSFAMNKNHLRDLAYHF